MGLIRQLFHCRTFFLIIILSYHNIVVCGTEHVEPWKL